MKNIGKTIIKGFYFGLLLQIAVGPVCLFIIKTAVESGVLIALVGVIAVTIIDALFVFLATLGIGSILEKPNVKTFIKYIGIFVLFYFGFGIILESFGVHIIPSIKTSDVSLMSNAFVTGFILTASNPLTILFWTGVFATRIVSEGFGKKEMMFFGMGAVLATFIFLGFMALTLGSMRFLLKEELIKVLNITVGIVLVGFGIKMIIRKKTPSMVSFN